MDKTGCAYGNVTRQMVKDIRDSIDEIKKNTQEFKLECRKMFNHYSGRWPQSAVFILTSLVAILAALVGAVVASMFG